MCKLHVPGVCTEVASGGEPGYDGGQSQSGGGGERCPVTAGAVSGGAEYGRPHPAWHTHTQTR